MRVNHLLSSLIRQKKVLVLSWLRTQFGEEIADRRLSYKDGRIILTEIACPSSRDLGMGTCYCYSHPTWREYEISRRDALDMIRESLQRGDIEIWDEHPYMWATQVLV